MDLTTITVADFKSFFVRDFPYLPSNVNPNAENANDYVLDSDITKAFSEAQIILNQTLYPDDPTITIAYYYLSAHYMVCDLKASMQGLFQAGDFAVTGRSVGNVRENYEIPERYKKDALLMFFTTSYYGQKYLSMTLQNLIGNMGNGFSPAHP